MWVRFKAAFDWTPPGQPMVTTAYESGHVCNVQQACGKAAIAAGKASEIPTPSQALAQAIAAAGNRWPRNPPVEPAREPEPEAVQASDDGQSGSIESGESEADPSASPEAAEVEGPGAEAASPAAGRGRRRKPSAG